MAREFARTDRIADAIQRILATAIAQEVRDPRVGMVNINDVVVSRDMAFAKVYITLVSSDSVNENIEQKSQQAAEALNHAAGFLRSIVAKELDIRVTPRLQFYFDKTSVQGQQLSSLIDKAIAEDEKNTGSSSDS